MALEAPGITWSCLQAMQVPEFYDHIAMGRHRIASVSQRLIGTLQMVSPYCDRATRMRVYNAILADALFGCASVDVLDKVGDRERLKLVGLALSSKGADLWRKTAQGRASLLWLEAQGATEDEAMDFFRRWWAARTHTLEKAERELQGVRPQQATFQAAAVKA